MDPTQVRAYTLKLRLGPQDIARLLDYLFATVLDGRNASLADDVQKALGLW